MAGNKLIFLHIPKTGGASLNKIISYQYSKKNIFTFDYHSNKDKKNEQLEQLKQLSEQEKNQLQVIRGHIAYGVHEFLPPGYQYITILRNPVKRVISLYNFTISKQNKLAQQIKDKNISLEDLARGNFLPGEVNAQTRYLAGQEIILSPVEKPISREMLPMAKKNLEKLALVGLLEQFDVSLLLLQEIFGWKNIYYRINNKTKIKSSIQRVEIDNKTRKIIEESNQVDMELYDYALSLFKNKIAEKEEYLFKKLEKFKNTHSSLYGQSIALLKQLKLKIR